MFRHINTPSCPEIIVPLIIFLLKRNRLTSFFCIPSRGALGRLGGRNLGSIGAIFTQKKKILICREAFFHFLPGLPLSQLFINTINTYIIVLSSRQTITPSVVLLAHLAGGRWRSGTTRLQRYLQSCFFGRCAAT